MGAHRSACALALLCACGNDVGIQADPDKSPPPPSDNPIDVAIWPRLIKEGLTERVPASEAELCRRVALDLTGVAPSTEEAAALCEGKSAEEMVRGFMELPRFVEIERRYWIRRFGADPTAMMGEHIADADRIIDAAAMGEIEFDDFAAQLLAHPIMTINRPVADGNDVTATVDKIFRLWLGRAPSFDEAADYANLLRPWLRRFEDRYSLDFGYYVHPAALDPDACKGGVFGQAACTSTLLGEATTIDLQITARVPTGYSQTSDRLFYYETVDGDVPAAVQAELEKPGRLLATRDEFWDEAADLALARMLGWWRSTANEPETVLPEVRRALAEWFRANRDLRELYVIVMTSLLYTTSATGGGAELPPWGTGPTKLLEPEQLLDSVERALGRELGMCDPHTDEEVGLDWYWPRRLRVAQPADWYGFGHDFYRASAQQLGGCLGAVGAPRQPGLPAMLLHIDLADRLCAAPSEILPAGLAPTDRTTEGGAAVTTRLFERFLSRAPSGEERAALDAATVACFSDSACGDVQRLARQTCGALLRSAAFLYY